VQTAFDRHWTVRGPGGDETPVTLPHDAMLHERRSPDNPSGAHGAYFAGGRYCYTKRWVASEDLAGTRTSLVFEGVQGRARVRLNGQEVGGCASGYREFAVDLTDALRVGGENLVEVDVDSSEQPSSRWYPGSGIYRRVWLRSSPPTGFAPDGVRFHTRSVAQDALVEVELHLDNPEQRAVVVSVALTEPSGEVAAHQTAVIDGSTAVLELRVAAPRLWSHRSPALYDAIVTARVDDTVVDEVKLSVGLRTLAVDAREGLRVNGERVLLRGACVHHDNGILGAATFRAAERRRARILKENGYNAVRSAHNPLSRDFLAACDEYGLYVMDELTDVWYAHKSPYDLADEFDQVWRDDARAMVAKDRNHPSVIMYSIGNEIAETATPRGAEVAAELHAFVHGLDPHRPTTLAVNFLLNVMTRRGQNPFDTDAERPADAGSPAVTSTDANVVADRIGGLLHSVSQLPLADEVSRDAFAAVDVAGYNYGWGRYAEDARLHPDRVIVGSESLTGDIAQIWPLVEELPNVIGDFMWTGWDYLGEAGAGSWTYGAAPDGFTKSYPHLVGGAGAVDITGVPGAPALLARAVWGELRHPEVAVRPLDHTGDPVHRVAWRTTDAIQSWAWSGYEGTVAEVEVYATDDEVELFLDGRSLGRASAGRAVGYVTRYRVPYAPGRLVAVGRTGGVETGRGALVSAGTPRLTLRAEVDQLMADSQDLAFVWIELADGDGVVEMTARDEVSVQVSGAGVLAGLGSAAPATEEPFTDAVHSTWYGRALAVVRAGDRPGEVVLHVTSRHHGSAELRLTATSRRG
jgi:hypothetical protein